MDKGKIKYDFDNIFLKATGKAPYPYQKKLALGDEKLHTVNNGQSITVLLELRL